MNNELLFQAVLDEDHAPVVLCDLQHTILYMNKAAMAQNGNLVGHSLMDCHSERARALIEQVLARFRQCPDHSRVYEFRNDAQNKDVYMIALRDPEGNLIGYYEKHEYRTRETAALYQFADETKPF